MNRLLIIRHGKTDWNLEKRIQGRTDIELNQEGIFQAKELAKLINLDEIDYCLCSPLKRTKQTADIIINNRMDIIYDDLLVERCFGNYEGTIYDEKMLKSQWDYKLNDSSNGLETLQDCLKRGKEFLDKINIMYDNKTILIITHGCFLKSLHYNITGYDENTDFLSFFPKNAEVYEYHI